MTLVLPYGPDQIGNTPVYSGSARSSSMPCVFDGEALDFESALMTDWNSDINVYDTPADDFSTRSPSDGAAELKRKLSSNGSDAQPTQTKKQRTDIVDELLASPLQSGVVSSSSSSSSSCCSESSSSSSSSSSSGSDGGQEDDASSSTHEDEDYVPRRRGPQMWNSRQRWKDERKRVLKLSLAKLAEIEDPELCMLRSVVINNTVKRLHADIKNERQAKLQQRQKRMDLFNERFHSVEQQQQRYGSAFDSVTSNGCHNDLTSSSSREDKLSLSADTFDDSSCDEMFGISEDFLRVTIPDRRVSTPIPTQQQSSGDSCQGQQSSDDSCHHQRQQSPFSSDDSDMDTSEAPPSIVSTSHTTCYNNTNTCTITTTTNSTSCDTAMDYNTSASSSPSSTSSFNSNNNAGRTGANNSDSSNNCSTGSCSGGGGSCSSSSASNSSSRRLVNSSLSSNSGSQCATQYRTSRDASSENSFPPRVPILDSVVYHSLLASLESS